MTIGGNRDRKLTIKIGELDVVNGYTFTHAVKSVKDSTFTNLLVPMKNGTVRTVQKTSYI
jgi:hypothetical protein